MSLSMKRSLPRRTIDLPADLDMPSTGKKPTIRASRIAQPIRRITQSMKPTGNEIRSISQDRNSYLTTHSSKKPRSSSATPMRTSVMAKTPLRTTPMNRSRTPSTERGSLAISTVERVNRRKAPIEDREWIQAQKIKILGKMQTIDQISQHLLDKGDFRDMSVKQFLLFMTQILKEIGGNRLKITPTTYADDISKYLTELGYPYTFNKSMLKTPNADHSINHIITMMSWLLSLTECVNDIHESEISYMPTEGCPNANFTAYFFQPAGFVLWNEQKDKEFQLFMDNICDEMAISGTGKDIKSLIEESENMEKELCEFNKRSEHVSSRKKSFLNVEKEIKEVQESKRIAQENFRTKKRIHNQLQNTSHSLQEKIEELQNSITELKNILKNQKMTVENREEILTSLSEKRNILQAKKKIVCDLERMWSEKQVSISRLLKEKLDLLGVVNNYIVQLDGDLKNLIDFKVKPLQMQFSDVDVDNLTKVFEKTDKIHTNMKEKYAKESNEFENTLAKLELARANALKESEDLEQEHQEWIAKRDQLHEEYTKTTSENRRRFDVMHKILDQLEENNKEHEAAIKRNEQTINVLKKQTEMMIKNSLSFANEKVVEKENAIKERIKRAELQKRED